MTKIIVGSIDGTAVTTIADAGAYKISFPGFLDMVRNFGGEIYEVEDDWEGNISELRKDSIEQIFKEIGISENIRKRTKLIAQYLGIASIDLEGKTYNPQARYFNKIPKDKLPEAHDKLYKKILNL